MKETVLLFIIQLFLFFPAGLFAGNDTVPRHYDCHFTNGKIVVDGRLDEKAWRTAPWSSAFVDIATAKPALSFLHTRFKMLWDSNYCYIAACLFEPDIQSSLLHRDDTVYHDNDFEVFIDPDGDGLNYYELEINALGTVMDLFMNKPYNRGGKADMDWNFKGLRRGVAVYGTLNNPDDTDSRWTVELAIPWRALGTRKPPADGDTWRFNFSRVEWPFVSSNERYVKKKDSVTGKNLPEMNLVWSPQGVVNMHVLSRWGYVTFDKKPGKIPLPEIWVWSQAHRDWSDRKWQKTLSLLSQAGIKGLLLAANTASLHRIAVLAACFDIQVHAWYVTMNNPQAPATWMSVNAQGKSLAEQKAYVNYYRFMCPALPQVRRFLQRKMTELAAVKGLSGIHFDYIRYVDVILPKKLQPRYHLKQKDIMPAFDYGYHPYMRSLFKVKYGIDPLKLSDPLHDTTWWKFRMQVLDTTVIQLRKQIQKAGLTVSAAVFPTPDMSRRMVRQDWDSWHLNYYFPMAYHNFYGKKYRWLKAVSETDKKAVGKNGKVFTGLFVPALKKDHQLTKAMKAALQGGADGIALFDLRVLDTRLLKQVAEFHHQFFHDSR
jgi:hypothetical protein